MFVSHFFAEKSFAVVVLDRLFFIWETKKVVAGLVRQVGVLYRNDFMGICLGVLSIACLRQVVVLDEWSSYRGGHLNRFDCISS